MELIPLAGSSSKGSSPEHSDQEDLLTVYAATEGKGTGHKETPLHRARLLAGDLEWLLGQPGLDIWDPGAVVWLQLGHLSFLFIINNNSNSGKHTLQADFAKHVHLHHSLQAKFHEGRTNSSVCLKALASA